MQQSITFEPTVEQLLALSVSLEIFKNWSEMSFSEFQQQSCSPVNMNHFITARSQHKKHYQAIKQLGDNIALCLGVTDVWESYNV